VRELGAWLTEPFGGYLGGVRLAGGGWVEGVSGLSFTTTSTNAAWTPTTVTKSGGTLTWRVYSAAGVLLLESVANKPTFNLSSYSGTKTLRVTSPDGWAGLTALNFTDVTADIASLNLAVATGLTSLYLNTLTGLTWTVGASAPMPTNLTSLYLNNLTGLTWTVGASAPMPTGLTSLTLITLTGLTWTVGASAPMPTGLTSLTLYNLTGLTSVTVWDGINAIHDIRYENNLAQAQVDAVLSAIHANKANYTYATPSLDLAGVNNAAPSGIYQSTCPPVDGNEYKYDLVNGICEPAGPEWVVVTA
jgi:hypothetical protein